MKWCQGFGWTHFKQPKFAGVSTAEISVCARRVEKIPNKPITALANTSMAAKLERKWKRARAKV